MAEPQESGSGSVEEEIDESQQSLSIEKGKRQRKSREDVATDCHIASISLNFSRNLILLDGLKGNSESTR
jgi:hypothetical protein